MRVKYTAIICLSLLFTVSACDKFADASKVMSYDVINDDDTGATSSEVDRFQCVCYYKESNGRWMSWKQKFVLNNGNFTSAESEAARICDETLLGDSGCSKCDCRKLIP